MMAFDCSPRCSLIRARFPIPSRVELPHELQADVVAAGPLVELVIRADAEDAGLNHFVGSLEAVDEDGGQHHTASFATDPRQGSLDKSLIRGELGSVGQGDHVQVGKRSGWVDQGDLKVIVLEGDDDGAGVQAGERG